MKSTRMSRKITGAVIRMMLLAFGALGILLTSLFLIGCGEGEEEEAPEVVVRPDPQPEPPSLPEPPVQQQPQPEPPPLPEQPLNDLGACAAGMAVKPGESCSYVAGEANVVFFVQQDGSACREGGPVLQEVFGAQVRVNNAKFCRNDNIEQDNAFKSNFAASKNPDGSWLIENVGGTPVADRPVDRCQIPPLNQDFGGKPVLFLDNAVSCVLLSDGNFASFACTANQKVIVVGGPVQTATRTLVKFAGIDVLNRDGVQIPDGELTEFETSDRFNGVIELKDNRTTLIVNVPKQDGDTIKGGHQLTGLHNISQGVCMPDLDKERPAVTAELTKYAKDLLDIMRENR